jgi:cold shock CspA family protein
LSADGVIPSPAPHAGRVTSFDAKTGLGTVTDDGGTGAVGVSFGFHATAIADGTRSIAVGTGVFFTVIPGHRGRYEASALTLAHTEASAHQHPA